MNKTQKQARRKRIQEHERLRKLEKRRAVEAEEMDELEETAAVEAEEEGIEEGDLDGEEAPEAVEKEMDGEMMYMGPTSFEELDAVEQAREQAHEIEKISWNVQDLVYNIIRHPMLKPEEKGEAIRKVGDDFVERAGAVLEGEEYEEKDLDLLSVEAVLAHDARRTGAVEKALDWIQKKTLTTRGRKKLEDSDFALPGKRKYPVHDKAHTRNALARAAQQMKRGGEAAADAKAALPKIRAAAKKFGIEMDTEKERTGIVIEKDASGAWRWVGWSTNKFMDADREILADAAHKEYTAWLDENPDMAPAFMSWHTPETVRKNAVDFWTYENGFLIMSGALTEEEAAGLLKMQKEIDLGMSHGSIVLKRDPDNKNIILKYRMYEVSDLPLENAANPFTSLETVVKEAGMDKKKYFEELFGAEKAQKYLALTKEAEGKLQEAGVKEAEKKDLTPDTSPLAPLPRGEGNAVDQAALIEAVVKAVGDKFGMEALNEYLSQAQDALERVPVLEELVKSLAENQDEALAEKISPKAGEFIWVQKVRASQRDDTALKDGDEKDEKLKKSAPRLDPAEDWLAMQTGVQPIRMQQ